MELILKQRFNDTKIFSILQSKQTEKNYMTLPVRLSNELLKIVLKTVL
tara:strand:- start:597 stop:740 length:144 start_codon:yes stop_codon:yes gene_type:complete